MTPKMFCLLFGEAQADADIDAFVSVWALSSIWGEDPPADLVTQLRRIWFLAHLTIQDVLEATGMSQTDMAADLAVPLRTFQHWVLGERQPPAYLLRLIAEHYGL